MDTTDKVLEIPVVEGLELMTPRIHTGSTAW